MGLERLRVFRHLQLKTAKEAARLDLYDGLTELLGPKRAEALMSYLPVIEASEVFTKSDLLAFREEQSGRFDRLEERLDRLEERMDRFEEGMDRMVRVLMGGLFMVVAALIGWSLPLCGGWFSEPIGGGPGRLPR